MIIGLRISWLPRLRFCGRCRNIEFYDYDTHPFRYSRCKSSERSSGTKLHVLKTEKRKCMDAIRSVWTPDSCKVTSVHIKSITAHFIQRSEWTPSTFVQARLHPWEQTFRIFSVRPPIPPLTVHLYHHSPSSTCTCVHPHIRRVQILETRQLLHRRRRPKLTGTPPTLQSRRTALLP